MMRTGLLATAVAGTLFAAASLPLPGADAQAPGFDEAMATCADDQAPPQPREAACDILIEEAVHTDLRDYARTHAHRAAARHARGKAAAALEDADIALDYDPYLYRGYMIRGQVLMEMGEAYRAIADFSVAAGLSPLDAAPYARRGQALFAHREYAAAAKDLESALEKSPNDAEARRTLAWIRAAAPDPALRDGQEALRLIAKTEDAEVSHRIIRAAALAEAGQTATAMDHYRDLVSGNPEIADRFRDYLQAAGFLEGAGQAAPQGMTPTLEDALRACLEAGCRPGGPRAEP